MAKNTHWTDDYWLLLMQLYLRKPVGVKPLYSRDMVNLALELHIPPQQLYEQMFRLRQLDTPQLEKIWNTYSKNPQRLARGVKLLRQMHGYGNADGFYDGVEVNESWERDFRPLAERSNMTPASLIMILDLYFRLVPATMVAQTPEVIELAQLLKLKPREVVEVMELFQVCDPYLSRDELTIHPLLASCQQVWERFGNDSPTRLAALAAQLKDFF